MSEVTDPDAKIICATDKLREQLVGAQTCINKVSITCSVISIDT